MNISITKGDIANGKRKSKTCCPVALACKRRFGTDDVEVDYDSIRINGRHYFPIEEFQAAFDAIGPSAVHPSHFVLEEWR
jgi:hypothetical protein